MAFGDVSDTSTVTSTGSVTSITTSTAIAISSGNLLIAVFSVRGTPAVVNFSDSAGGSWANLTSGSSSSNPFLFSAYQYITTPSTNLTITASFNGISLAGGKCLAVSEFVGLFSSSPLDTNPAAARFATSTAISNPTGALSTSGELIFTYVDSNINSTSYVSSSPFSIITALAVGSGTAQHSMATARYISTSNASVTATWTTPATAGYCCIASFKPSTTPSFQWYPMDEIGLANERLIRPGYEVVPYDA